MRGRFGVLATVLADPILRRLEAAFLLFSFAEWATWVAVIVYAYGRGGPGEAGIVVFVELAPSVFLSPAIAGLGDRFPRARVLFSTYAAQAILMAVTAMALTSAAPSLVVYALAAATATSVALSRPIHASLMPEVVASPDDLTAANVVSGMAESSGSLNGPLGAGILIAIGGPMAVFAAGSVATLIASLLVLETARRARRVDVPAYHGWSAAAIESGAGGVSASSSALSQAVAGLTTILADRRLRSVVAIATWATFLVGALDIFFAVLAIDLLAIGDSGVGFLGAVTGAGSTVGAAAALLLVGRERLGLALGVSAAVFGLSIGAVGLVSGVLPAVLLLASAGVGSGLTVVASQTMIQRLAGDDVMSRVFGVLQGLAMGATALGALAVPVLVGLVGERAAFVVAGVSLPLAFLALGRAVRAADRLDPDRAHELRLLRGVHMLGPLSAPVLERLAADGTRVIRPAGATIVRTGDAGDRFYLVIEGTLEVSVAGAGIRALGPGDGFGEIALIRDVPRTATIVSTSDVTLLGIDREPFLCALTGQPRSRFLAADLAAQRLAADHTRP
jgi:MFS family permease